MVVSINLLVTVLGNTRGYRRNRRRRERNPRSDREKDLEKNRRKEIREGEAMRVTRGSQCVLVELGQSTTGPGPYLISTADSGEAGRDYSTDWRFLLLTAQGCRQAEVSGSIRVALVREKAVLSAGSKGASALGAGGWMALQK